MTSTRLSALDASFLAVETPTAHMHIGWVALFSAPAKGPMPRFSALRDHIGVRLERAPRYRQKLAFVPLGLHAPEWVDDPDFSVDRHVHPAPGPLHDLVDEVMSVPLRRDRPLWEIWICEDAGDRQIALVGKLHHCMADGLAAVELASLLVDPTLEPVAREPRGRAVGAEPDGLCPPPGATREPVVAFEPRGRAAGAEPRALRLLVDPTLEFVAREPRGRAVGAEPDGLRLLAGAVRDRLEEQLCLLRWPLRALTSPSRLASEVGGAIPCVARAVEHSLLRPAPESPLNTPLSPSRRFVWRQRPFDDLRRVRRAHGTTVNDVLLAAVAGGLHRFVARRGDEPIPLKAMIPVNVRESGEQLGNRISFVFADLPCDEPDPVRRLQRVHATMTQRKRDREPEGAEMVVRATAYAPGIVQHALSRLIASPRTFNLVVSNIPGPTQRLYMCGCPLRAAYPVVPLADRHALSIGMTSVCDRACLGIYADHDAVPDAERLARDLDAAITELVKSTASGGSTGAKGTGTGRRRPAARRGRAGRSGAARC